MHIYFHNRINASAMFTIIIVTFLLLNPSKTIKFHCRCFIAILIFATLFIINNIISNCLSFSFKCFNLKVFIVVIDIVTNALHALNPEYSFKQNCVLSAWVCLTFCWVRSGSDSSSGVSSVESAGRSHRLNPFKGPHTVSRPKWWSGRIGQWTCYTIIKKHFLTLSYPQQSLTTKIGLKLCSSRNNF